jgi:CO/xanthine dehydrogenase Mo-binding subunit
VEVEAATGRVKVLRYAVAEDIGRVLNPIVATGQTQGGVLHGIGGALFERFTYDETGQLITATLADYLVPRFSDAPTLAIEHLEYPTPKGPLGAKSVGEGAAVLPPAVLGNAVEDALKEMGVRINHAHLAPEAVYQAIERARARGGGG